MSLPSSLSSRSARWGLAKLAFPGRGADASGVRIQVRGRVRRMVCGLAVGAAWAASASASAPASAPASALGGPGGPGGPAARAGSQHRWPVTAVPGAGRYLHDDLLLLPGQQQLAVVVVSHPRATAITARRCCNPAPPAPAARPALGNRRRRPPKAPASLSGGEAKDRCCCAGDCGVPRPRGGGRAVTRRAPAAARWSPARGRPGGHAARPSGGQVVTRARFHDHELVLDHGAAGACPPARSSAITGQTLITALRAAATTSGAVPARSPRSPSATGI